MAKVDNDAWQDEQEKRIKRALRMRHKLGETSERPEPSKREPTEREIRVAMLELRGEIARGTEESNKKAPRWDPDADRIIVGPSPFPGGKVPKHYRKPLI